MRVTIIKSDNTVGINGEFLPIDCSALPANFHALQWYGDENYGEVEWDGRPKPPNTEMTELGAYQTYVDAWHAEKARLDQIAADLAAQQAVAATPTPVEVMGNG